MHPGCAPESPLGSVRYEGAPVELRAGVTRGGSIGRCGAVESVVWKSEPPRRHSQWGLFPLASPSFTFPRLIVWLAKGQQDLCCLLFVLSRGCLL